MPIGESLRRARTERGLELATVSEAIKIRVRYLRALEAEDWDALPAPAYARGFLRTYATYLGLDADQVLKVYNTHFGPPKPTLPNPPPGPARSEKKAQPRAAMDPNTTYSNFKLGETEDV